MLLFLPLNIAARTRRSLSLILVAIVLSACTQEPNTAQTDGVQFTLKAIDVDNQQQEPQNYNLGNGIVVGAIVFE